MKRITMLISFAMAITGSSPVIADFADDFESYAAGAGLPLPWVDSSNPSGYSI